jgi:hypothetical protein
MRTVPFILRRRALKDRAMKLRNTLTFGAVMMTLASCASKSHDLNETGGVVIKRTACPAVAVPDGTGDVTLFNPADSRDARAIDIVASISNVTSQCGDDSTADGGSARRRAAADSQRTGDVTTNATFVIEARRTDASAPRDVVLPYFATVVQGGKIVISKRISTARIHFDAGQFRSTANGEAGASIDRTAATLPLALITKVNKKRKSGTDDAAIDPLADPAVREQIARATFELLIGFQLTADQLQYNATR